MKYLKDWWGKLGEIAKKQHFGFVYNHLKKEVEELGEPGANREEELEDCLNTLGLLFRVTGYRPDFKRMLKKLYEKDGKFGTTD
jgi:hypothetical protein